MMLTYHISHEKIFSTALYVHGRSGVNYKMLKQHPSLSMPLSADIQCNSNARVESKIRSFVQGVVIIINRLLCHPSL